MKKHFFAFLVLIALCLFGGNANAIVKTYSYFNTSKKTLTFYYNADGVPSNIQNSSYTYAIGDNWEHSYSNDTYADQIERVVFDKSLKVKEVKWIQKWFRGLKNLKSVTGFEYINPTETTNLEEMFKGCTSLQQLYDFDQFNTSNVKKMNSMFEGCTSLEYVDFTGLDLSKVTTMNYMFKGCTKLRVVDLRGCSTASLTYAEGTFYGCSNLETIFATTSWISPSNSNNGLEMFTGCTKLRAKEKYNPSWTSSYFASGSYYFTIDMRSSYPVESYARFYNDGTLTFYNNKYRSPYEADYSLNSNTQVPKWIEKHQTAIKKVVFDISFSIIYPTTCFDWFSGCSNLTTIEGIQNLKLSASKTCEKMFYGCSALTTLDLSSTAITAASNLNYMFDGCTKLSSLKMPKRTATTSCTMKQMFGSCTSLKSDDFLNTFSTAGATDMSYMFYNCTGLTKITDSGTASKYLVTSSATDLGSMFRDCSNLTDVSVTKLFDAPNVTSTAYMFDNCSNLNYIFLGCTTTASFDMSNVTNIQSMFAGCGKLKAIFVKNDWNTSKVSSYSKCFEGDVYLKGCNGTSYSSSYIGKTYARIDKPGTKGYLSTYKSKITYINCPSTYYSSSYTDFTADKEKTIADPTRNGYVFQGWTGTGLSSYTKNLTLPIYSSGDREYTANWLKDLSYRYYHIQATPSSYTYTGEEISYTITIDGTPLEYGKDYNSSVSTIKNADTYTIAISGITENGYINTRSVSFTINPKTVTVTPDAISKTYGDADPAKITYTYTGFCGSDGFTTAPVFKRATGENVGEYSYSLYTSPKYNSNYYVSYDYSNKFTIRPKPITVTPAKISKTYGDVDPEITYSANGLINSDKLSGALSREEGENVGEYSVTIGTLKNANYDISVADVKFSIIPKTLTTPTIVTESEVYPYTGSEIIPAVSLYDNGKLIDPSEYTVTISNNNGIGNGLITITDNPGGNYYVSGTGSFQIVDQSQAYKVTIKSSGVPNAEDKMLYAIKNQPLNAPIDFAFNGYTLLGVYKDATMLQPFTFGSDIVDGNITLYANWLINSHTLEFVVDGTTVSSETVNYGAEITAPEPAEQTGYTFAWIDEIPATMPDNDLTINGAYTANVYRLVYKLDGAEYHAEDKEYGASITALASPASRNGYKFSGWSSIPSTMPDKDVEINGSYVPNKHTVKFITFDEEFLVETAYNVNISSILPNKDGYRFVPKAGSPTTVPDYDLTIEGKFEVRTYAIKYIVDNQVYKTVDLYLGDKIKVIAAPTKTGHTFSGWSEAPAKMPAKDIEITGEFIINQHTITYYIDGEVFKTVTVSYGSRIHAPSAPYKSGLKFSGWGEIPETMPDKDLQIRGTYSSTTPVADVVADNNGAKVWAYNSTIYIETAPDTKYTIIDLQGHVITTSTTKSTHEEVHTNQSGILIVKIGNQTFKLAL